MIVFYLVAHFKMFLDGFAISVLQKQEFNSIHRCSLSNFEYPRKSLDTDKKTGDLWLH